jgi:hypothetical protein
MDKKTVVYIGNGIGGKVQEVLSGAGYEVKSLDSIKDLEIHKKMDLIIADDQIKNCTEGEGVQCTVDDVVFLRNRAFAKARLIIYSNDEFVSRYFSSIGYMVLPKSENHENLVATVKDLFQGQSYKAELGWRG